MEGDRRARILNGISRFLLEKGDEVPSIRGKIKNNLIHFYFTSHFIESSTLKLFVSLYLKMPIEIPIIDLEGLGNRPFEFNHSECILFILK